MRRTATADVEFGGRRITRGDKVILWYASANRDEAMFDRADLVEVDRPNARRQLSFGFGIHRCVGARLAEAQIQILLEEMLTRGLSIDHSAQPVRAATAFVNGYASLQSALKRR